MNANIKNNSPDTDKIWIISKGKYTDSDLDIILKESKTEPVTEYRISDLAKYMLSPHPVQINKKLIGCEIFYLLSPLNKIKKKIRQILPAKLSGLIKNNSISSEVLLSDHKKNRPFLTDKNLELHLDKIEALLRHYEPALKKLLKLDKSKMSDIKGICEDIAGKNLRLNMHGSIDNKIEYICRNLLKDVGVILEKAQISEGSFEMKGFDCKEYDSKKSYRLIKFFQNGKPAACVLDINNQVEFRIDNVKLIYYMQLLELSLKINPKLYESLNMCAKGIAVPLKLFFHKQLDINYSETNLPEIYKKVFDVYNIGSSSRDVIINVLNNFQFGIIFNYIPESGPDNDKMFTNISVMHNFRALEPIKDDIPQLYSEINKMTSVSEIGKFYLLDSIRGCKNE